MGNKRSLIRSTLKDLIENDPTFVAFKVISTRTSLVSDQEELPSISIVTPLENARPESLQQKRYIRILDLKIEIRVAADSETGLDDYLDDTMATLEDFMLANESILGTTLGSVLISSELDIGYESDQEIGLGTLLYQVTYVN